MAQENISYHLHYITCTLKSETITATNYLSSNTLFNKDLKNIPVTHIGLLYYVIS